MDHSRAHPAATIWPSQFHIRASKLLQKLSIFSIRRRRSTDPYQFTDHQARSLDVHSAKPYMSQPAFVSDLPPEHEGSSRSTSPVQPTPTIPVISFPGGGIAIGLNQDGRSSSGPVPQTSQTTVPRTVSVGPKPRPAAVQMSSPPPGRSVSFDIPRPPIPIPRSPGTGSNVTPEPAPARRSFEFRRAVLNRSAEVSSSNFLSSTSLPWTKSAHKISPNISSNRQSIDLNSPSEVHNVEGLPPSGLGGLPSTWWRQAFKLRQNSERIPETTPFQADSTEPTPAERRSDVRRSISDISSLPPTYKQAASRPLGQMDSPSGIPARKRMFRLSSLPPAIFLNAETGNARLSPSVVTRQAPLPIQVLPTLPPPDLSNSSSVHETRAGLRTIPTWPSENSDNRGINRRDGVTDDEEDVDEQIISMAGNDEEDLATPTDMASPGTNSTTPLRTAPDSTSFTASLTPSDATSTAGREADFFPSNSDRLGSLVTSIEWDTTSSIWDSPFPPMGPRRSGSQKYYRASKSMANLLSTKVAIGEEPKGKGKAKDMGSSSTKVAMIAKTASRASRMRRQRSLPTFTESSDPPPYPTFRRRRPRSRIQPREEEGAERLPDYTNSILLSAILPRKVEFSAPGVPSKDRKWRRQLCVLEGTAFKVFSPPTRGSAVGVIGNWWERQVGVGDLTSAAPLPQLNAKRYPRTRKDDEASAAPLVLPSSSAAQTSTVTQDSPSTIPTKKRGLISSSLLSLSISNVGTRRQSMDVRRQSMDVRRQSMDVRRQSTDTRRQSMDTRRQSIDVPREDGLRRRSRSISRRAESIATRRSTSPASIAESPLLGLEGRSIDFSMPGPEDLLRTYTLQRAESGLATDYTRRKNVIRVRMEGEQFLLQAPSIAGVVDWIEGFQAATGIALDLEERPMPKGPNMPRRRRRRMRLSRAEGG